MAAEGRGDSETDATLASPVAPAKALAQDDGQPMRIGSRRSTALRPSDGCRPHAGSPQDPGNQRTVERRMQRKKRMLHLMLQNDSLRWIEDACRQSRGAWSAKLAAYLLPTGRAAQVSACDSSVPLQTTEDQEIVVRERDQREGDPSEDLEPHLAPCAGGESDALNIAIATELTEPLPCASLTLPATLSNPTTRSAHPAKPVASPETRTYPDHLLHPIPCQGATPASRRGRRGRCCSLVGSMQYQVYADS